MKQHCLFCGRLVSLVHVHGHYQCTVCHTNTLPCCDGDNCDTNLLLKTTFDPLKRKDSMVGRLDDRLNKQ